MAEREFLILIRNREAVIEGCPEILCGNSDYTITFDFDDEWSLTGVRTARFVYVKNGAVQHEDVPFQGNTVAVPVMSDVAFVKVGVFAGDLCTTTPVRIKCRASIRCGSGEAHEPTPDEYQQIMALFNEMAEAGAFGATEEQAQQLAQNTQDIGALQDFRGAILDGTTPAAEANRLGGHEASYFASAEDAATKDNIVAVINGMIERGEIEMGEKAYTPSDNLCEVVLDEPMTVSAQTVDDTAHSIYEYQYLKKWIPKHSGSVKFRIQLSQAALSSSGSTIDFNLCATSKIYDATLERLQGYQYMMTAFKPFISLSPGACYMPGSYSADYIDRKSVV